MININEIDISKRCGITPENTIFDFLEKVSNEKFQKSMENIISWKTHSNPDFREVGLDAETRYTPYLKSQIKDIPESILDHYTRNWCTDGINYYFYKPCCM